MFYQNIHPSNTPKSNLEPNQIPHSNDSNEFHNTRQRRATPHPVVTPTNPRPGPAPQQPVPAPSPVYEPPHGIPAYSAPATQVPPIASVTGRGACPNSNSLELLSATYQSFAKWVHNGLESTKGELSDICHIVFVEMWMSLMMQNPKDAIALLRQVVPEHQHLHTGMLQELMTIVVPGQINESLSLTPYRKNQTINMQIHRFTYRLLLCFVLSLKSPFVVNVIQKRISFEVIVPSETTSSNQLSNPIPFDLQQSYTRLNRSAINWSLVEENYTLSDIDSLNIDMQDVSCRLETWKVGAPSQETFASELKENNYILPFTKRLDGEATVHNNAYRVSLAPEPRSWTGKALMLQHLHSLKNRVPLHAGQLPSALCYNVSHCSNSCSMRISKLDGSKVAVSYNDSSIRILSQPAEAEDVDNTADPSIDILSPGR
eukprot:GHVP01015478.1.p1 GENE.GHVP01015478.1~~GHVP01015478.1.p1  ORF type:complete len:430 (+),score=42.97 GHVP01015478.1:553-1842(+)